MDRIEWAEKGSFSLAKERQKAGRGGKRKAQAVLSEQDKRWLCRKKRQCCRDMIDRLDGMRKQSKNTEAVAVGEKKLDGNGGKEWG